MAGSSIIVRSTQKLCYPDEMSGRSRGSSPKNASIGRRAAGPRFVVGRAGFAKISAIEGIRLTAETRRQFRQFDEDGLTAAERRRQLSRIYGGKLA